VPDGWTHLPDALPGRLRRDDPRYLSNIDGDGDARFYAKPDSTPDATPDSAPDAESVISP